MYEKGLLDSSVTQSILNSALTSDILSNSKYLGFVNASKDFHDQTLPVDGVWGLGMNKSREKTTGELGAQFSRLILNHQRTGTVETY